MASRMKSSMMGMVDLFSPGTMRIYNMEVQNLGAAMGSILRPVVQALIPLLQQVNTWLTNLTPTTKAIMAAMAMGAAAIATFGSAWSMLAPLVTSAIGVIQTAIGALSVEMGVLDVESGGILPLLGLVATALVGCGGAAAFAEGGLGGIGDVLEALTTAFEPIVDVAGVVVKALADALVPVVKILADNLKSLAPLLQLIGALVISQSAPFVMLAKLFAAVANVLETVLAPVFKAFQVLFGAFSLAMDSLGQTFTVVLDALGTGFTSLIQTALKPLVDFFVGPLLEGIVAVVKGIAYMITMLSVLIDRFREGRLGSDGFFDEVNEKFNQLQNPAGKAGQTYASRQASYQSIGQAGMNLQIASLSAGQAKEDYAAKTFGLLDQWRNFQVGGIDGWINKLISGIKGEAVQAANTVREGVSNGAFWGFRTFVPGAGAGMDLIDLARRRQRR